MLLLVFVFGVRTKAPLNPIFFNASQYSCVAFSKGYLLDDRSHSLLLIDIDLVNSLKKFFSMVRVFIDVDKMSVWYGSFLFGSYVLLRKSKVISRKFTICKLALMVILRPQPLNDFITFFFTLSVFGPGKPSSLHKPTE